MEWAHGSGRAYNAACKHACGKINRLHAYSGVFSMYILIIKVDEQHWKSANSKKV
jgi:hypothetical protein